MGVEKGYHLDYLKDAMMVRLRELNWEPTIWMEKPKARHSVLLTSLAQQTVQHWDRRKESTKDRCWEPCWAHLTECSMDLWKG